MQKRINRVISLFMVALMVFTSIPVAQLDLSWFSLTASAENAEPEQVEVIESEIPEKNIKAEENVPLGEIVNGIQTVAPETMSSSGDFNISSEALEKGLEEVKAAVKEYVESKDDVNIDGLDFSFDTIVKHYNEQADAEGETPEEEILPDASGTVNETITWTFTGADKTLTFSGTGEIPSYYPAFYYADKGMTEEEIASLLAPWDSYLTVIEKLVIGDGITAIGEANFITTINLTDIDFGETLKTIGSNCFGYTCNITKLTFPSSLETMGDYVFFVPLSLRELYLNEGLKSMGEGCFDMLTHLEKAYIPSTLEQTDLTVSAIGPGEFTFNCKQEIGLEVSSGVDIKNLESYLFVTGLIYKYYLGFYNDFVPVEELNMDELIVVFIDELEKKSGQDFDDTESQFAAFFLLYSVLYGGELSVRYCADENLIIKTAEDSDMHSVCSEKLIKHTVGDSEEFCECFTFEGKISDTISWSVDKETRTLTISGSGEHPENNSVSYYCFLNNYVDYVVFSEDCTITDIGAYAFDKMDIIGITIPDSVKVVKEYAFYNCAKLEKVLIDNINRTGLTIETMVFSGCESLKEIYLPEGVDNIAEGALNGSGIEKITIMNKNCKIDCYIPYKAIICCYSGSTAEAIALANGNTIEYLDPFTVDMLEFKIGEIEGFEGQVATVTGYTGKAKNVEIPAEINGVPVVAIANYAFSNNGYMKSVKLPESVVEIDTYAFYYNNLNAVYVKDLAYWLSLDFEYGSYNPVCGADLYFGDELVTDLVIPEGTETIKQYAFYGCESIKSVTLPSSLKFVGDKAFYECTNIEDVYVSNVSHWLSIEFEYNYRPICNEYDPTGVNLYFGGELATEIVIPEGITELPDSAFRGCKSITKAILPSSLTSIGDCAFEYSTINEVVFPSGLVEIGSRAFAYTLLTEITIPSGVEYMHDAFSNCKSLEKIEFEEGFKEISDFAFEYCYALKTINLPSSLERIGSYAFSYCESIENITIPSNVNYIEYGAFRECENLKAVYIFDLVSWLSIDFSDEESNPLYLGANLHINNEAVTKLVIPEGVETISEYAFYGCEGLSEVTLSEGVKEIGNDAFYGCKNLTEVSLPSTLTDIGSSAFSRSSLTEITIPKDVYVTGFSYCEKLETVILEEGITHVGSWAFKYCTALKNVTIPSTLERINSSAFVGCENLENVYADSFDSWKNIYFSSKESNPLYYADNLYFGESLVTDLTIPEGTTEIGSYSFAGYSGVSKINLPTSLTYISYGSFSDCENLESVIIDAGRKVEDVLTIDTDAFEGCTKLSKVYVNSLDEWTNIEFNGETSNPLNGGADLYIGGELLTDLVIPDEWTTMNTYLFYGCKSLEKVTFGKGLKQIAGGSFGNCTSLKSVDIPEGIEKICWSSFFGCTSLGSVTMADTVKTIEASAFNDCYTLKDVKFSANLETIGEYAFTDALEMKSYNFPESLRTIGVGAFWNNTALESVVIPEGITIIDESVFRECVNMKTVEFPSTLVRINSHAFYHAASLESLIIPDSVTYVEYYAFAECDSLTDVKLSNSLNTLGSYAFYSCDALGEIVIPESVNYIEGGCFAYCPSLYSVSIGSNVQGFGYYVFSNSPNVNIYGIPGSYAETYAKNSNIPFWNMNSGVVVNIKDENGEYITNGFVVNWYDDADNLISTGMEIKNIIAGEKYKYEIVLDENLSYVYKGIPAVEFVAISEAEIKSHTLERIPEREISGIVTDTDDKPLSGVKISVEQTFAGKYKQNFEVYTNEKGEFTATVYETETVIDFTRDGFYNYKRNINTYPEGKVDLSVKLSEIPQNRIKLILTKSTAVLPWNTPVISVVNSVDNLNFNVYDQMLGRYVDDFTVQYPYIVIDDDEVTANHNLTISVFDSKNIMTAEDITITLDNNKQGEAKINFLENGKIAVGGVYGVEKAVISVFDENGNYVTSANVEASISEAYTSGSLPAGEYKVVAIESTKLLRKVSSLSSYAEYGLAEGTDYVVENVTVNNGIISTIDAFDVPVFNQEKICYTVTENSFITTNVTSAVAGKYITVKAAYELDSKYDSSKEEIRIALPEGVEYVAKSLTVDGKASPSMLNDNIITVITNKEKAEVRFYVFATTSGKYDINADLKFVLDGSEVVQPITAATFEATDSTISVIDRTPDKEVYISGVSNPGNIVKIYDYNTLIGTAKANGNGRWQAVCELDRPEEFSVHKISAEITTPTTDSVIKTEEKYVVYDEETVALSKITMYNGKNECVFDFRNTKYATPSYTWSGADVTYTFKVEFTDNNPEKIGNVYVVTTNRYGDVTNIPCVYDDVTSSWIATTTFTSTDAPSSITAAFADLNSLYSTSIFGYSSPIFDAAECEMVYNDGNSMGYKITTEENEFDLKLDFYDTEDFKSVVKLGKDFTVFEDSGDALLAYNSTNGTMVYIASAAGGSVVYSTNATVLDSSLTEYNNLIQNNNARFTPNSSYNNLNCWINRIRYRDPHEAMADLVLLAKMMKEYNGNYSEYAYNRVVDLIKVLGASTGMKEAFDILDDILSGINETDVSNISSDTYGRLIEELRDDVNIHADNIQEKYLEGIMNDLKEVNMLPGCGEIPIPGIIRSVRSDAAFNCPYPPVPNNDPENISPCIDPSGYVYEAVPSNRVEGVKAEAYYYDYPLDEFGVPAETKEEIFWEASEYDQVNPLYTDSNGQYAWDVPPGQWLVKYSKDGYYDTDSRQDIAADEDGYLPVPPPQVEVNTAIVSKSAPAVSSVNVYGEGIQLIFSQYMKPATVNGNTVKVTCNGNAVSGTITASNAEYNYEETEQFASIYEFVPEADLAGTVSVTVSGAVNYNGKAMESAYSTSAVAEVKPEGITVPEKATIEYNSGTLAEISIYPAQAGANKTLTVISSSPSIVSAVNSTVTTDENGKANVMLQGNLPGSGVITVSVDGTNISTEFTAEVGNVEAVQNKCEKVVADIATGSKVARGTKLTLTTATEGAEIYYTLDGTCPCVVDSPSRILYTGPITLNEDTFIIAYAVKDGFTESATAGFVYTIDSGCAHADMKIHNAVAATCTKNGSIEYYECSACSKLFADANGENEITDTVVKATGHKETTLKAVSATCSKTGLTEGKKCSICGTVTIAQKTVAKKAHTYKTTTTKATLKKNGKTVTKCTVCGYVSKTVTVYYPKTVKLSTSTYTYNGKTKTPSVVVKDSKGKSLKKNTDYTVKYAKDRKKPGKYTITVTFKGKYEGTKKLTLTIKPKAPSISKLTSTKGKASFTWTNVTGESGYQVYYSTKKSSGFKKVKSYKYNVTKGSKTKLKSGKKYYFKVRAYKKTSSGTVYSAWSSVKSVKVK